MSGGWEWKSTPPLSGVTNNANDDNANDTTTMNMTTLITILVITLINTADNSHDTYTDKL